MAKISMTKLNEGWEVRTTKGTFNFDTEKKARQFFYSELDEVMEETSSTEDNLNLTEKEIEFLQAFGNSDFYEDGIDSIVWDYSVNDELTYTGKTRSGVVSSLSQKDIINVSTKQDTGERFGTYNLTKFAKTQKEILDILG